MKTRLLAFWQNLSTSLWFVPAILTGCAFVLASVMTNIRAFPGGDDVDPPDWLYNGSASEARDLLETLLSSLITLTTLAISITMVVLSLAASQLGPRLIRAFMGDRRTQVVLGIFLAAIVYVLLVLRQVDGKLPDDEIPQLAVTLGTMSAMGCLGLLFFFVHHLGRSVVADSVVQRVGAELDQSIDRILPRWEETPPADTVFTPTAPATLRLPHGGYVQAIDFAAITHCAEESDVVVLLNFRPGHHLLPGGIHGKVDPAEKFDEAFAARIARAVTVGLERTPVQDIEYCMRQLVEVALRALSPGINDPNTAIAAIDRLGRSMALVMTRRTLPETIRDAAGRLRVVRPVSTFAGLMDAAFNQIRQAGESKPSILIRQLEAIAALATLTPTDEHRRECAVHAAMILAAGRRCIAEPRDLEAVEAAYDEVAAELRDAGLPPGDV